MTPPVYRLVPCVELQHEKVNCFPPIIIPRQRLEQLLALDGSRLANTIFVKRKTLRGGNKSVVYFLFNNGPHDYMFVKGVCYN